MDFTFLTNFCPKVYCKGSCSRSPSPLVIFYNWEGRFQHVDIPPCFLSSSMRLLDSFYEYLWLEWTENIVWSFNLQFLLPFLRQQQSLLSVLFSWEPCSLLVSCAKSCNRRSSSGFQTGPFHSDSGEIRCLSDSLSGLFMFPRARQSWCHFQMKQISYSHQQENSPPLPIPFPWLCTVKSRWKRV